MRQAIVYVQNQRAGILTEVNGAYTITYDNAYAGDPISLTMPVRKEPYLFDTFPPFLDGLLPEGFQLEALLKKHKIDRDDYFSQLITVGHDLIGAVTIGVVS